MPSNVKFMEPPKGSNPPKAILPCQQEWHLYVQVQAQPAQERPQGKIKLTISAQRNRPDSEKPFETMLGEQGVSPVDLARKGMAQRTLYVYAASADHLWQAKEDLEVTLDAAVEKKRTLLATLVIEPSPKARLRLLRNGTPVAGLPCVLGSAAGDVAARTDADGVIEVPVPQAAQKVNLLVGAGERSSGRPPSEVLVLFFDATTDQKDPSWERTRLSNLGIYPPDRVSPLTGGDADELAYQHALAIGSYEEKERSFAGGRLGPQRGRVKALDESKSKHVFFRQSHLEDEFALASSLGAAKPQTHVHGPDAGERPAGNPKGQGYLDSFHDEYVWNGRHGCTRGDAIDPASLKGLRWEDHALVVEKATGAKCGSLKGEFTDANKVECPDCLGLGLAPAGNPVFDRALRPHLFFCIQMCRDWNDVKERCLDGYGGAPGTRTKLMLALIGFRNHYVKSMVQALRDKGLRIVAQAVGSADLTSDYDVTLAGPDDLYAFGELNAAFRKAWKKESGVVLDTNFYFLREWLSVGNNIVKDGGRDLPGDKTTQLEMDEQVSDLYSLAKIRRYTSKAEWKALTEAIYKGVELDGLKGKEIPLFGRLEKVDDLYRKQYVDPLLARLAGLQQEWRDKLRGTKQDLTEAEKEDLEESTEKATPRTLERLIHYDRDAVLHECNLAYLELVAQMRRAAAQILAANEYRQVPGVKVRRVWRQTMKDAVLERPDSNLNAGGLYQRNRLCGKLFSEAHLFAAESYNTQASMKDVVAKQGNFRFMLKFTPYDYLHCFNEQVGDGLKEIREYQRMVDEHVEQKRHLAAHAGEHRHGPDLEKIGVGFYRASKYEIRMKEVLECLMTSLRGPAQQADRGEAQLPALTPDQRIRRRIAAWKAVFPGEKSPDEKDLELLQKELELSARWKKALDELLDIRKSRKKAESWSAEEKRAAAEKLVAGVVGSAEFVNAEKDPARSSTKLAYEKEKYKPQEGDWKLRNLTDYLLHHCAQVNQIARRLLSRGESEIHLARVPKPR